MWTNLNIFGGYNDRSEIAFDTDNLINLFVISSETGKKKFAFLGTPGLQKALDVFIGTYPSRALYVYQGVMYGVFGSDVYRFTPPLIKSRIGTIGTSQGFVSITANTNNQLIFADGQKAYLYNVTTGVFSLIDKNTPASAGVPGLALNAAYLDGFFVIPGGVTTDENGSSYQISAYNDGTKWDPLDRALIQAYPGQLVGVGVVNRRLFFFKTDSTEVWYNAGAADFPFRRDNNLLFNFGCMAASSIVADFGYLFWLARDVDGVGGIMMTTGAVPTKISNESIDNLIASFTNPADVVAYIYRDMGHIFLVMTWNKDDTTLVYDVTMQNWHQMEMHKSLENPDIPNSGKVRHLSNCHAFFNNTHYIGSYKSPTLYEFSRKFATNDGEEIRRVRTLPHFSDENYRRMQVTSLQIDMQMGIGLSSGLNELEKWIDDEENFIVDDNGDNLVWKSGGDEGTNPKIYIRISRDGGNSYGNYHAKSIGRIGQRKKRAKFRKLGIARDLVFEISFYDPVLPVAILGASINYEVLNS